MVKFFKSRKQRNANLTWEEKNSADYIYYPKDTSKLQDFIKQEHKTKENPKKNK